MEPTVERVDIDITIPEGRVQAAVQLQNRPARLAELVPFASAVVEPLIKLRIAGQKDAGREISCKAGCGACCRQLVPLSPAEALYIAEFVAGLREDIAAVIRARFATLRKRLEAAGLIPELMRFQEMSLPERSELSQRYFNVYAACPFLENESCGIYPDRPVICREYLVTSPVEHCGRDGDHKQIRMVPTPVAGLRALSMAGEALGAGDQPSVPFALALEWAAAHKELADRTWPIADMVRRFLAVYEAERPAPSA